MGYNHGTIWHVDWGRGDFDPEPGEPFAKPLWGILENGVGRPPPPLSYGTGDS